MPDIFSVFDFLEKVPSKILAIIIIILLAIYYFHYKKLDRDLSSVNSKFEITKGLNQNYGHITIFPISVEKSRIEKFKFQYNCIITINANDLYKSGYNVRFVLSEEFELKIGSTTEKSRFLKPMHSVYLNSDFFQATGNTIVTMSTINVKIFTNQKRLDLSLETNFGTGSIKSNVFLAP